MGAREDAKKRLVIDTARCSGAGYVKFNLAKDSDQPNKNCSSYATSDVSFAEWLDDAVMYGAKYANKRLNERRTSTMDNKFEYGQDVVHGYKAFNADWTCMGKQYTCPGIFHEDGPLIMCAVGMHFCEELSEVFSYYEYSPKIHVCEVIGMGQVERNAVDRKCCCTDLVIVRELTQDEIVANANLYDDNKGVNNTGHRNTGNWNTGNENEGHRIPCYTKLFTTLYEPDQLQKLERTIGAILTGASKDIQKFLVLYGSGGTGKSTWIDLNAGHKNTGHCNTGDQNLGSFNTSDNNDGNYNSGLYNTGDYNAGSRNKGCRNTGRFNIGAWNTGSYNTGDYNAGSFNVGDYHVGWFNTEKEPLYLFNKPARNISVEERIVLQKFAAGLAMSSPEQRQCWWDEWCSVRSDVVMLPNFDPAIFKACTGIDARRAVIAVATCTKITMDATIADGVIATMKFPDGHEIEMLVDGYKADQREIVVWVK